MTSCAKDGLIDAGHHHGGSNRRLFLRNVAGGTAFLTLAGCLPKGIDTFPEGYARRDWKFFDPLTLIVFAAAAEAILEPRPDALPAPSHTHLWEDMDAGCAQYAGEVQDQLKLLARAMQYGTSFDAWPPAWFSNRPAAQRQQILQSWFTSRIGIKRVAANSLKMVIMSYYFAQSGAYAYLAYDGPLLERADIPYFESYLSLPFSPGALPALPRNPEGEG